MTLTVSALRSATNFAADSSSKRSKIIVVPTMIQAELQNLELDETRQLINSLSKDTANAGAKKYQETKHHNRSATKVV